MFACDRPCGLAFFSSQCCVRARRNRGLTFFVFFLSDTSRPRPYRVYAVHNLADTAYKICIYYDAVKLVGDIFVRETPLMLDMK